MGAASHLGIDLREYDSDPRIQADDRREWLTHLQRTYHGA